MNEEILTRIKDLANDLTRSFSIESVVLFGSIVEGKADSRAIFTEVHPSCG